MKMEVQGKREREKGEKLNSKIIVSKYNYELLHIKVQTKKKEKQVNFVNKKMQERPKKKSYC